MPIKKNHAMPKTSAEIASRQGVQPMTQPDGLRDDEIVLSLFGDFLCLVRFVYLQ